MEQLENLANVEFHNLNLGDELIDLHVNRKIILPHVLNKRFCDATREESVADSCEHGFCKNDRDVFGRSATISIKRINLIHVFLLLHRACC